jgi:hypothetical protein
VVAEHAPLGALDHQIEALGGVRAVADHVAQAVDLLDAPLLDVRQDGAEGFNIRMDIAQDSKHTLCSMDSRMGLAMRRKHTP